MPPNSLKLTQVSVSKLKATHRLSTPIPAKNSAQAQHRVRQTGSGSSIWVPISDLIKFLRKNSSPPASTAPISQYSTEGFHLMNSSLWAISVAPPNSTMTARLTHCMGSTLPLRSRR